VPAGDFDATCLKRPPYLWLHPSFVNGVEQLSDWPAPEHYDELAARVPREAQVELPRFVSQQHAALREAGGYEQHVAQRRAVPTRPRHWHDFFNMAVWAHFPALRWALNGLHVAPGAAPRDPGNGRTKAQNLATSFDEAGMLVVSESRAVLEGLRAVRFKHVFWEQRAELEHSTRFWIVGHGLLESLLTPHPHLVARSLLLHLPEHQRKTNDELRFQVDQLVAAHIDGWRQARTLFDPIPVCAIPGYADNDSADFYDDRSRLPFDPISRRPDAPSDFLS
jgi:hypothetical protein